MPLQACASIREEAPTGSLASASVAAPPGCFIQSEHASPAHLAAPATASAMRPPGSWGAGNSSAGAIAGEASDWSETHHVERCTKPKEDGRTTVMLRNLPSFFTRDMLVELLDSFGFAALYDFVRLPVDIARLSCLGFGFVN